MPLMQERAELWLLHIQSFWTWWSETLVTLLPTSLKARLFSRRADVRVHKTTVQIDLVDGSEGRTLCEEVPLDLLDDASWAELDELLLDRRARVILPARDTYEVTIALPQAAQRNVGSAIALQLSAVSPLEPAHLCWAWQVEYREKKTLGIMVAMARKASVESIVQAFQLRGIVAPPIWCETRLGPIRLVPGKVLRRSDNLARERMFLLASLALLATIPITNWAGAKLLRASNDEMLRELRTEVAPLVAADRAARRAEAMRQAMRPLQQQPVLSALVNDLASALPEGVYIQNLEVRGVGSVQVSLAGALKGGTIKALAAKSRLLAIPPIDVPADAPSVEFLATVR